MKSIVVVIVVVVIVVIVAALGARAHADRDTDAAYTAGVQAYSKGDYATAIAALEAVFRAGPRAEVAFTLAQAHRNQYFVDKDISHLHRALGLYRHYLAQSPGGTRAPHARLHLETIEAILASLPREVAPAAEVAPPTQLLVTTDVPAARASIDGGAFARVPLLVEVNAGTHRVRVEAAGHDPIALEALAIAERLVVVPATLRPRPAVLVVHIDTDDARITIDGHPARYTTKLAPGARRIAIAARGRQPVVRDVELAAGETRTVDIALVPTPRRRAARWTLFAAAGLGGAALVAGGVAWLEQREALSLYDELPRDLAAYEAARDRRNTWRAVSIGLAASAGVAAATGAVLWYFDLQKPAESAPRIAPAIGPESVGAAVFGRF